MKFHYPSGATPLDQDEAGGLIPKHITLQTELNEWEQSNILEAESWQGLGVEIKLNLWRHEFI